MTEMTTKRIATLTTGAIKTTMESAIKAMMDAVEAAEQKTQEMREATEQFVADFEKITGELADNVNTHISACQAAIDTFQTHHLKILNVEVKPEELAPEPMVNIVPVDPPRQRPRPVDLNDELGKLASLAASPVDGRR
jgi:Na+/phosphate symporter